MQNTSDLYKELLGGPYSVETRLAIGETGHLITKTGEAITFGGTRILVGTGGAEGGYGEDMLISMSTSGAVFSQDTPTVGGCVSAEISVEMLRPVSSIPRQARLAPYVRLTDGTRYSEWIQKGVFYIDTRAYSQDGAGIEKLTLHGYDDMLKAEQDCPVQGMNWPAKDIDVVCKIAEFIGVPVDARTREIMTRGYLVQLPTGFSCRETLGYIAAMYAGCFVMSDVGELRLITINSIPPETRYLITEINQAITFGGDRILV